MGNEVRHVVCSFFYSVRADQVEFFPNYVYPPNLFRLCCLCSVRADQVQFFPNLFTPLICLCCPQFSPPPLSLTKSKFWMLFFKLPLGYVLPQISCRVCDSFKVNTCNDSFHIVELLRDKTRV